MIDLCSWCKLDEYVNGRCWRCNENKYDPSYTTTTYKPSIILDQIVCNQTKSVCVATNSFSVAEHLIENGYNGITYDSETENFYEFPIDYYINKGYNSFLYNVPVNTDVVGSFGTTLFIQTIQRKKFPIIRGIILVEIGNVRVLTKVYPYIWAYYIEQFIETDPNIDNILLPFPSYLIFDSVDSPIMRSSLRKSSSLRKRGVRQCRWMKTL